MYFHSQNLNVYSQKKERKGSPFWHGRFWWGPFYTEESSARRPFWLREIRLLVEWHWFSKFAGFRFSVCEDEGSLSLNGSCFLLSLSIALEHIPWISKLRNTRELSFSVCAGPDPSISLTLWRNPMAGWSSWEKWWQRKHIYIDIKDMLLGYPNHGAELLHSQGVIVPMPEGAYAGKLEIKRCVNKRPRWPFGLVWYSGEIEIPGGIPVPGKGENGWDCGQDAIFSQSHRIDRVHTKEAMIADSVANLVRSAIETRLKRGGAEWTPAPRAQAQDVAQ